MARIMINCPQTNKPVPTGLSMNKASFEEPTNMMEGNSLRCPECRAMHTWGKKDAFLEDE